MARTKMAARRMLLNGRPPRSRYHVERMATMTPSNYSGSKPKTRQQASSSKLPADDESESQGSNYEGSEPESDSDSNSAGHSESSQVTTTRTRFRVEQPKPVPSAPNKRKPKSSKQPAKKATERAAKKASAKSKGKAKAKAVESGESEVDELEDDDEADDPYIRTGKPGKPRMKDRQLVLDRAAAAKRAWKKKNREHSNAVERQRKARLKRAETDTQAKARKAIHAIDQANYRERYIFFVCYYIPHLTNRQATGRSVRRHGLPHHEFAAETAGSEPSRPQSREAQA
jgi:hypothetical protein